MNSFIESYLITNGPSLSSDIKSELINITKISDVAARKQISRANGDVFHLRNITFPKNESFLYLKDQYQTSRFYQNLYESLIKVNSITGYVLSVMDCLGGKVSINKFNTFAPVEYASKKNLINKIKEQLLSIDFIQEDSNSNGEKFLQLNPLFYSTTRAISIVHEEKQLLSVITVEDFFKKNSFGSYNKFEQYGNFSGYTWDITCPSYLLPFRKISNEKILPGFLVADVLPEKNISERHVKYFIEKIENLTHKKNVRPFLPFLIGEHFSDDALMLLREKGVCVSVFDNLLGKSTADLLRDIILTMEECKSQIKGDNSEKIEKILKSILVYEGKTINIKGSLFEMLVANIIYKLTNGFVKIGKLIELNREKAEIDIFCEKGVSGFLIIECKAHKAYITREDIDRWKNRITLIYQWIQSINEYKNRSITFEYWCTSDYDKDALDLLKTMKECKKYQVEYKNLNDIKKICSSTPDLKNHAKVLKEYYE